MIELWGVATGHAAAAEPVLCDLDLQVAAGQVVLISGATGAGKSTLCRLLYGAELPSAGVVQVLGRNLGRLRASSRIRLRQRIGVVSQRPQLLSHRTVGDNVALAARVLGWPRVEIAVRVRALLTGLRLGDKLDVPVAHLSEGERQRVALCRALLIEPAVLVADEPSAHLDERGIDELLSILAALQERGSACVVTTREPALLQAAARCGWPCAQLREGRLHWAAAGELPAPAQLPGLFEQSGVEILAARDEGDLAP
jgi:cell division transport system ATP-binding protein